MLRTEFLTRQFYAWEQRGRGWNVWDEPVELEPPFVPFELSEECGPPAQTDDGRRSTLLSRLSDRLAGRGTTRSMASQAIAEEVGQADIRPSPDQPIGPLAELGLRFPPDCDISPEATEQFLLTLRRLDRPLAFEVIGSEAEIWTQFVCAQSDQPTVARHVKAYFPEAVVASEGARLSRSWGSQPGNSVVVEFGLSEEFMLPLLTPKRFTVDPLTAVAAALADLEPGETGALQVLLEPVRHHWAQSITRAVLDEEGSPFFLDAPEITTLARDKVSRPLFAAVVRVAARSRTYEQAMLLARSLGWALGAVANPPANRLIPLSNDGYPDELHELDFLERRTRRSGMILSASELVALVHPPSASVRAEKLVRRLGKTRGAPATCACPDYVLGQNAHDGKTAEVGLTEDQRSRHLYVIGASGTGKSTLLLNLILQDLRSKRGLAVLDPHGDLVDEILHRLPPERLDDVVLIDPADAEYPIGFNILSAHSELERTLIASDLVAVFRRLSTSWGDQMTSVLGNAILAILESERGGTLVDLRRFLVEPDFRREFLTSVRDPEVVYYWQKEYPLLTGKPQAPLLTRLDTFLRPKPIRYMVAQKESRLDLRHMMDEGKILLARLSQGAIGEENAYLLGTLLVSKLHQLAISRQELAASERRPFYLYIDEFQNFVTPSMEQILSGARKYRLGLVLAHQDLRQIQSRSPEVLHSVLANPYARVCFRVGDHDARTLAEGFTHFDARDLQSLSTGQALVRIERAEFDFNLASPMLPVVESEGCARLREVVVARSRERFARPRGEVEEVLRSRGESASSGQSSVDSVTPPSPRRHEPAKPVPQLATEAAPTAPAVPLPTPASSPGRGGRLHKYLQELIRRWADANGWRATIEEPVLDGLGIVDVALRNGQRTVACEIRVTTTPEHELGNIQKCLAAGFEHVFVIGPDQSTLRRIQEGLDGLDAGASARVQCALPEELFALLDQYAQDARQEERMVRGYRVKVRVGSSSVPRANQVRSAVSGVIAKALRRKRNR